MVHCRLQNKTKAVVYTYLSETISNLQGLIKWWRNFWKCMCITMYQFYNKSKIPSIKCFRPLAYRRLKGGNSISCLLVGFSFHCSQQRNHTLQKRYTCSVKKNIQHVLYIIQSWWYETNLFIKQYPDLSCFLTMKTEEKFHWQTLWCDIDHCQWKAVMDSCSKGSKGKGVISLINKLYKI